MQDELVLMELAEMEEAVRLTLKDRAGADWTSWVRGKGNLHRLFTVIFNAVISQWAGNGIIGFYLAPILKSIGVTSAVQQQGINGGLTIMLLCYCIPLSMYLDRFKRWHLWLGSTVFMIICYSVITACSATYARNGNRQAGKAVVAFIYLYQLGYQTAYGALYYAYMCPLLPTAMRTQGVAISLVVGYAMAFFNQYCNPIAFNSIGWHYYFLYLALLLVYFVLIWCFFPETRGLSSEEASVLLDGAEAVARVRESGLAVKEHGPVLDGKETAVMATLPVEEKA